MLRISKLTDYGTVVLVELARADGELTSAAEVASGTGIGLPTVSKLLKALARAGLVSSVRGARGGYRLARPAHGITAADVIDALEGPVSITECSAVDSNCEHEDVCSVGGAWQKINIAIRRALDEITLVDLQRSHEIAPRFNFAGVPITIKATAPKKS